MDAFALRFSYVEDPGTVIKEVSKDVVGKTSVGIVVAELPQRVGGFLVEFYDGVCGRLGPREAKKKEQIRLHEAIETRVIGIDEEKGRIHLALAQDDAKVLVKSKPVDFVKPGTVLLGRVERIEEGASVGGVKKSPRVILSLKEKNNGKAKGVLEDSEQCPEGLMPLHLISDCLDAPIGSDALSSMLTPRSSELPVQLMGDRSGMHRVCTKRFIIEWINAHTAPKSFEHLQVGELYVGVVTQRRPDLGYFVEIAGGAGLTARVPLETVQEGEDGECVLSIGQTVMGRIGHIDSEKKMFTMSLSLLHSFPENLPPLELAKSLLRSAVAEQQWLAAQKKRPAIGTTVFAKVVEILEGICILKTAKDRGANDKEITAFSKAGNFPSTLKVGDRVEGIVLEYVWPRGDAEIFVLEEGGSEKRKGAKKDEEECNVALARRDYIIGVKKTNKELYFLPARLHPNQIVQWRELPAVGDKLCVEEESLEDLEGVRIGWQKSDEERVRRLRQLKQRTTEKRKREISPSEDCSRVKKFGVYKVRVEGPWVEEGKARRKDDRGTVAVKLKVEGGRYGRLHACELPQRFHQEATQPAEEFLKEFRHKNLFALVIAIKNEMRDGHKLTLIDFSLNEEKLANGKKCKKTMNFTQKFSSGGSVQVYYVGKKPGADSVHLYEANPHWRAILTKNTSVDAILRPERGEMRTAQIISVNKKEREIVIMFPRSVATLLLANGQYGILTLSGVSGNYEEAFEIFKKNVQTGKLLDLVTIQYQESRHLWLLALPGRVPKKSQKMVESIDPLIHSINDVASGSSLRGFVLALKKTSATVELSPGVTVVTKLPEHNNIEVNDVIKVMVVKEEGHISIEFAVEMKKKKAGVKRGSEDVSEEPLKKKRRKQVKGQILEPDWKSKEFSMEMLSEVAALEGVSSNDSEAVKDPKLAKKELEGEMLIETEEDFQKEVMGTPNSSELWIRYITYFMMKDDLTKARATAERALKTINYRDDGELAAMWSAYINLEVSFGDSSTAQSVFTRACQSADSFAMHKHMAAVLASNGHHKEAEELYEMIIKKFRSKSDEVWIMYADYLMNTNKAEDGRNLLKKALESVPKTRHVPMISRFAQLEYSKGDVEKGRNLFESLLSTYPKRTDLWTVYIDLTIKQKSIDQARILLERVTEQPLSIFKLRPFFKKWTALEDEHGNEATRAEVRKRAERFLTETADSLGI